MSGSSEVKGAGMTARVGFIEPIKLDVPEGMTRLRLSEGILDEFRVWFEADPSHKKTADEVIAFFEEKLK